MMVSGSAPNPPTSLGKVGRRAWRELTANYVLEDHERRLVAEACGMLDRAAQLDEQVEKDGVTVPGSKGQPVVHPGIPEARQHRQAFSRMIAQLSFPDDDGRIQSSWASRSRRGAAARRG